ncbi:MAG: alkaline phosphatase family protein [Odoribacteraceae bacterium]|nr:alkaline phosphatase family protein [Odoribacteraceae bacterium]
MKTNSCYSRALLLLACLSLPAIARPDEPPRLVVGIVISHFYPEWLAWYDAELPPGGFKRLAEGPERSLDYNYFYSRAGVDHASIYTGAYPATHGVISRAWHDRLRYNRQEAFASASHVETGSANTRESLSPGRVIGPALGDVMKINNANSKTFSIAMNGEEAVPAGGASANMAIWYSEETGQWITSSYYAGKLPAWLARFNQYIDSDLFTREGWKALPPPSPTTPRLAKTSPAAPTGFRHDVARARKQYNTYRVLKATPRANTLVRSLAAAIIATERLGEDDAPDLLAINFSCLDYMHRDFPVDSEECRDLLLRLDDELRALFSLLDASAAAGKYTLFLTFAEARELLPPELERLKLPAGYFSVARAVALTRSYLGLLYGDGEWIIDHDPGQLYLNRDLIEQRGVDPREIQDRVAGIWINFEGVDRVMTAYSLARAAAPPGTGQRVQNSFHPERSGDILFCLQPGWVGELKTPEDYRGQYSRRSVVPLYFHGARTSSIPPGKLDVTRLAPLLREILGIPPLATGL